MSSTIWIIDGTINLTAICTAADWNSASIIDGLVAAGLTRSDAEAFADFACADHATRSDRTPEECVSDEQYERITLASQPVQCAYAAGAATCRFLVSEEIVSDERPPMCEWHEIPSDDARRLERLYGGVSPEMETAYRRGYNAALATI